MKTTNNYPGNTVDYVNNDMIYFRQDHSPVSFGFIICIDICRANEQQNKPKVYCVVMHEFLNMPIHVSSRHVLRTREEAVFLASSKPISDF